MYNDFILAEELLAKDLNTHKIINNMKQQLLNLDNNIKKFENNPTNDTYAKIILSTIKNLDDDLYRQSGVDKKKLFNICRSLSLQKEHHILLAEDDKKNENKENEEKDESSLKKLRDNFRTELAKVSGKIASAVDTIQDKLGINKLHDIIQNKVDDMIFKNKDGSPKLLYRFRGIITSLLAVFVISFSLALMNIGVKIAGEDLNQVKSLNEFVKMIYKCAMKNISSFFIISLSFILFITSTFFLFLKLLRFILNKIKALFNYIAERLPSRIVTPSEVKKYEGVK
jgi:hypothetical protein